MLGELDKNQIPSNLSKIIKVSNVGDLKSDFNLLYIYSDIVETQISGDIIVPLFGVMNVIC